MLQPIHVLRLSVAVLAVTIAACRTASDDAASRLAPTATPPAPTSAAPRYDYYYPPDASFRPEEPTVTVVGDLVLTEWKSYQGKSVGNVWVSEYEYDNGMRVVSEEVLGTYRKSARTYDAHGRLRTLSAHSSDGEVVTVYWDANGVLREVGSSRFTVHAGMNGELPPKFGENTSAIDPKPNGPYLQTRREGWWTYFDAQGVHIENRYYEPSREKR